MHRGSEGIQSPLGQLSGFHHACRLHTHTLTGSRAAKKIYSVCLCCRISTRNYNNRHFQVQRANKSQCKLMLMIICVHCLRDGGRIKVCVAQSTLRQRGNERIAVFLLRPIGRPFCMLYRFYTVSIIFYTQRVFVGRSISIQSIFCQYSRFVVLGIVLSSTRDRETRCTQVSPETAQHQSALIYYRCRGKETLGAAGSSRATRGRPLA